MIANRHQPSWWTESRAADEAQIIEESLARRLWALDTIVTAAPLLGLVGTVIGMMSAFQVIGSEGIVNPTAVTGGVAEALIATVIGLIIALIALFGFNYFSRLQSQTMDEMERLGTRLIDHIRLDQRKNPMKLRKSRIPRKGYIQIIPMIDVMFFLLATFMLASLSMQKLDSLQVNLPKGQAEKLSEENRSRSR